MGWDYPGRTIPLTYSPVPLYHVGQDGMGCGPTWYSGTGWTAGSKLGEWYAWDSPIPVPHGTMGRDGQREHVRGMVPGIVPSHPILSHTVQWDGMDSREQVRGMVPGIVPSHPPPPNMVQWDSHISQWTPVGIIPDHPRLIITKSY